MFTGFKRLLASALLVTSTMSQAAVITSSDVDSVSFTAPSGWTGENTSALIDGNTAQFGAGTDRFVGRKNSGADLSASNSFLINVDLLAAQELQSISFFNDWGFILGQQVMSMDITAFGSGLVLGNWSLTGLAVNSFSEISLVSGLSIAGVDEIEFAITGLDNVNFEIREFVINVAESQVNNVNAPAILSFLLLAAGALVLRRK